MAACSRFQSVFFVNESLVSSVSTTAADWWAWWRLSTTTLRLVCWNSRPHHHLDLLRTYLLTCGIGVQNLKGSQSSNPLHQYLRTNIKFVSTGWLTWRRGAQISTHKSHNYLPMKTTFTSGLTARVVWWNNVYEHGALCQPVSRQRETNFGIFCNPITSTSTEVCTRQV
jgi:hypothetical protein